jgi:methionine aminopeptidase
MKGGISMMNIKTGIFKLIYGDKTPKRKKIFVKEIDVLKIEPWVSEGNFDIEHADALLEDIHEKQYMRDDILVKDVYKDINMLIEGAYVAGLNDAKDMSDEDINARTKELISKIELLR